jgi:phenylacetate-CoA ligase
MNFLGLYHKLPGRARSVAASVYGAYLACQRYGGRSEQLTEEARERETWSPRRWDQWRQERLAYLLHRAATKVPYYRDAWARRRAAGFRGSWELLENWPVLEKEEVRRYAGQLVASDRNPARMRCEHTSGTSGTPLNLWLSREAIQQWYALVEERWRRWYGVSRHDAWAILGGQLVAPAAQRKPPFWVWNAPMRQLYMSSYHLSPRNIPYYCDAIRRYGVRYILGYSSALHTIACEIRDAGLEPIPLAVVIANAEPLYDYQRKSIAQAFLCPARETYGMSEMVVAASECACGTLHLWPEAGVLEIDPVSEEPHRASGNLIATGLCNADMPLIRYRTGDRATMTLSPVACACGRTLPALEHIEGRSDDVLYTADGRAVGRMDTVFKANFPIREAQIVQESLDLVRLRYVPADRCAERDVQEMREQIGRHMDGVLVIAEAVHAIPRGPNNKFRAVICNVPREQLKRVLDIRTAG